MKMMIRKPGETYEVYVPKKDLEEAVVAMENPGFWGGWIELANGWRFQMPEMDAATPLPVTVDARKLGAG